MNVIRLSAALMALNQPDVNGLRGVIVNTSGVEAFNGASGQVATAAASGALHSITKPLAADLASGGIRVVTIAPGLVRTPLCDHYPKEVEETIGSECILAPKRFGDPDEFAHAVQTIVTNPYLNATTIKLSAGLDFRM